MIENLDIADVKLISPRIFRDARGFFSETFNQRTLAEAGLQADFVQDNHSLSIEPGVVRGLHFQTPPHAQGKLVRVVRGSIFDVAVDLRRASATFGQHVSAVLSAENWQQLWVPEGFAHGFCTLEPNTEVIYKVTAFYAPESDSGVFWADPALGIDWPVSHEAAVVSPKDQSLPTLGERGSPF